MANIINSLAFGTGTYVITLPYATCATAAGTQAKVATLTPNTNWSLETGARVSIKFDAANSASSPTLNVNQSGAKTIRFRGAAITSSAHYWAAGSVVDFVYDGTYWQMLGAAHNTTYSLSSFGITATATELNYTDGVTSNIQTQLNGKAPTSHTHNYAGSPSAGAGASSLAIFDTRDVEETPAEMTTATLGSKGARLDFKALSTIGLSTLSDGTYGAVLSISPWGDTTNWSGGRSTQLGFTDNGKIHVRKGNGSGWSTWKTLVDNTQVSNSAPTLAWGTTSTIATVAGTALTVTMPANPDTNTYGRTSNTTSKIYLMGGTSQSDSNKTTYSNVNCYASGGYLYSGGTKVSVEGHTHTFTDTNTSHSHAAGDGISLTGSGGTTGTTTIALATCVAAGACGPVMGDTLSHSSTFYVPQITYDAYGRITAASTVEYILPSSGNTDTKVTQAAAITATTSASYPVMLGYSTATTSVTNTLNKSAKLLFNTGTGALTVGSGSTAGSGTLTVDGDIIAGGGSDSYGIHPKTSNYSTLGKSNKYWYKVYSANVYTNSLKKLDGTDYSFTMTWNNF